MFKLGLMTVLFLALAACLASNSLEKVTKENGQMPHTQAQDKPVKGSTRILSTVMTAEGVECPAVRGADGTLYTIPSMPQDFEVGDKLNIIIADPIIPIASFCQQGQTIEWLRIEWVSVSGEILKYWEK